MNTKLVQNYTIGCTWFLHNYETNEFLMMLRDDKPNIPYPNKWVFPGGTVKGNETPKDATVRELEEGLGYKILECDPQRVTVLYYPPIQSAEEHFFYIPFDRQISELTPNEGQEFELFYLDEIKKLDLGFWCKEVISILERFIAPPSFVEHIK